MTDILNLQIPSPTFGGSTGGWLRAAETEEKYAITWTSKKEQVFEMPISLQNLLYENMQINVFESGIDKRLQKKKNINLKENKEIEIKNVKIRYLPVDQPRVDMKVKRGFIVSLTCLMLTLRMYIETTV